MPDSVRAALPGTRSPASPFRRQQARRPPLHGRVRARLILLLLFGLLTPALPVTAQAEVPTLLPPTEAEAWLVTYGPGEVYWQRFGHNAIWLREPGGLNHAFNYGFFDFEQDSFLLRFVQGRMLYFAAAIPIERELALYASEGREVRIQRLNLSPASYALLREHLLRNVRPENRDYLYDYYLDNCSTRLRDALDLALGGALSAEFTARPATQNFRDHTRRSTQMDRAYYLGLVTALGLPVDREISIWDEQFLPAVLADSLLGATVDVNGARAPLITEDRILLAGLVSAAPATAAVTWPRYLLLGLLLAAPLLLAQRRSGALGSSLQLTWLLLIGTLGLALLAVWGFTDHRAANPNLNLLLLQPLAVLAVLPALRRFVGGLLGLGLVLALVLSVLPGGQYQADPLALLLPVNLLAIGWLWQLGPFRRASGAL